MSEQTRSVCITRCESCGLELAGFQPHRGECPRCDAPETWRPTRWIHDPHPATLTRAECGEAMPDT